MNRNGLLVGGGLLVACALWLASAGPAGAAEDGPVAFRTAVKVIVDEAGHPVAAETLQSRSLPGPIREFVEARARELRFQPPLVDGRRSGGTTYVVMGVCAVAREGDLVLAAAPRSNGPGYADSRWHPFPPLYPADALRNGDAASLVANYVVETDGSTTVDDIVFDKAVSRGSRRIFERAVRAWMADLRHLPEEVGGQPVRTRMSMPIEFSLGADTARHREEVRKHTVGSPECLAAEGRNSPGQLATASSPFVLLPDPG